MTQRIAGALANCTEYDRKSKQIENEGFKHLVKKLNPSFNFLVQNIFLCFTIWQYFNHNKVNLKTVVLYFNLKFPGKTLPKLNLCLHLVYNMSLDILLGHYYCTIMLLRAPFSVDSLFELGTVSQTAVAHNKRKMSFIYFNLLKCCCLQAVSINNTTLDEPAFLSLWEPGTFFAHWVIVRTTTLS